jgi:hypothetical protein
LESIEYPTNSSIIQSPCAEVLCRRELIARARLSSTIGNRIVMKEESNRPATLGNFIASRLVEIGCDDYFCVPGDFNMSLLDELNAESRLNMVHCCNELNAGMVSPL